MENKRSEHHYSEPVNEIMGSIPSFFIRWGALCITGVFVFLTIGCCIIRYPQTLSADITISSQTPTAYLLSKVNTQVDTVLVSEGQLVYPGDVIALFSNSAIFNDINTVKDFIEASRKKTIYEVLESGVFNKELKLGDIQPTWAEMVALSNEYKYFHKIGSYRIQEGQKKDQISLNEKYTKILSKQIRIAQEDCSLQNRAFLRDSCLFSEGLISVSEYEQSRQAVISKLRDLANYEANIQIAYTNHLELRQELDNLYVQNKAEETQFEIKFRELGQRIESQLLSWLETYAIISPLQGIVSFHDCWGRGQPVSVGNVVATVVPIGNTQIEGRMNVSSNNFGRIEVGQKVNVSLNGFPYIEYGFLRGEVSYISKAPDKNNDGAISYRVVVLFPDGMMSTYGKKLPLIHEMNGSAVIITQEKRLIQQILQPLLGLIIRHLWN